MRTLLLVAALAVACAPKMRRFPDAPPVWHDNDDQPLAERPDDYWSGLIWDGADQIVFQPTHRALSIRQHTPAENVNAWDEVPNSSWFENRIGVRDMSLEEVARGSCPSLIDPAGPWTVKGAKPNGANPGFGIKDQHGKRFLLKFDGHEDPERATTADVVGSRIYHAAGFYSPCNVVVYFDADILEIDPEAESEDERGNPVPMTQDDIDKVLAAGIRHEDGRYRASASLFLPGRPIGPWTYQGKRKDDPNDVIRHEDRRELRGAGLLAAWLNHFDAREQNTLAIWYEESEDRAYVRHYYLDFGDCFGSKWDDMDPMLSRRFGFSYYFDATDVLVDTITLGGVTRPWETVQDREVGPIFGFYDVEHFEPEKWKGGYPNPSFNRMQAEDGAWMARIIARMTDDHLRAMIGEGKLSDPTHEEDLFRTLSGRRDRILDDYLRIRSPLADFEVDGDQVCFTDLAALTGVTSSDQAVYRSTLYTGNFREPVWSEFENATASVHATLCVPLVRDGMRPHADDPYAVLDLEVFEVPGQTALPPARLHLLDRGDSWSLVGIERPADARPPR